MRIYAWENLREIWWSEDPIMTDVMYRLDNKLSWMLGLAKAKSSKEGSLSVSDPFGTAQYFLEFARSRTCI